MAATALETALVRRRQPEAQIQRAVLQHIKARGVPNLFAFHVPSGGYRRKTEAAIFKGLGVVAGVPDLILIHQGLVYGLEIKTSTGVVTLPQQQTHAALRRAGATVEVVRGLDEALRQLEKWGLLRGSVI